MSDIKKTLAIVDDHPIVIEGLKALMKENLAFDQIVTFTNGKDFMSFLASQYVDLVLLDVTLPDMSGIDLCKQIKACCPDTIVLGLSNHAERSIILQLLDCGASGYMLKSAPADELLECIQEAQYDEMVFSSDAKKILTRPGGRHSKQLPSITKREKQILQLLAAGKTTTIIAGELHLSPFTIDTYRKNLLQKFEVKNTSELLMLLVKENLL
ncbi:response regulator transcription factor [Pseudobacter ginsenosidimutans]|uniref:LuxR family two component transcriptional regulator n=1 Tax=Pseudobacter ginsenosidimutans TaxID=661488 RepID=A0A4Q7MSK9_9BACT|nr:response regulator transcription factor [Pseudobacter ginsenosidimutans]QEC42285.1 response regulator transcription factor [Pseudobacter ginsenosidimutans]RZS70869.1 LuxR family two component transcriptional regulator [Pseudobacter ginsenosidimutans]